MVQEKFIRDNRTGAFKKGDKAVMHSCYEATLKEYKGRVWECLTDSYCDKNGEECVHLKGYSGAFYCEYLQFVKL